MLEVALVIFLCSRLGRVLRAKGRKAWPLQLLLVVGWFVGEALGGGLAGFAMGFIQGFKNPGAPLQAGFAFFAAAYVASLLSAGLVAGLCFLIARALPSLNAGPVTAAIVDTGWEAYPAELVAPPPSGTAAGALRSVRLSLVGCGAGVLALLAGAAWWAAERNAANSPWTRVTQDPAQDAAGKQFAAVQSELTPLREQAQKFRQWQAQAPSPATSVRWSRAASVRSVVDFLERGNTIATLSQLRRDALPEAERTEIDGLVRAAVRRGSFPAGTLREFVWRLGDEGVQQAFRQSLASADDIRVRYPKTRDHDLAGLVLLLDQESPESAAKLLTIIAELSPQAAWQYLTTKSSDDAWSRLIGECPRLALQDTFAQRIGADERWRAAIRALRCDYLTAQAAAEWMVRQPVQPALREEVIGAVRQVAWLPGTSGRPAATILCQWAEKEHAPLVVALGLTPGTDQVATNVCRTLVRLSEPRLADVIRVQGLHPTWNRRVADEMLGGAETRAAILAALAEVEPHDAHIEFFQYLGRYATEDNLPSLTQYASRLDPGKLPAGSRLPASVEATIQAITRRSNRR